MVPGEVAPGVYGGVASFVDPGIGEVVGGDVGFVGVPLPGADCGVVWSFVFGDCVGVAGLWLSIWPPELPDAPREPYPPLCEPDVDEPGAVDVELPEVDPGACAIAPPANIAETSSAASRIEFNLQPVIGILAPGNLPS